MLILGVGVVLVVLGRGLASFGMSPWEAYQVLRAEEPDATAIRHAEGPISTPNGIAERGFVRIGGIEQWVTMRGEDRRNPVILILHGGPGDAVSQLAYFFRHWEHDFTVVQWDQRGAGRTYGRYGKSTPNMTLAQFVDDAAGVADYARRHLHQRRIILLGHSWGSALGMYVVKRHPELFAAFIGTAQLVRTSDLQARYYRYTLARLRADGNDAGVAKLLQVGPPPYRTPKDQEVVRFWLNHYLDVADRRYLLTATAVALRNERYTLRDFRDLQAGHLSFSLPVMGNTYDAVDLNSLGYDMPVPFFIIDGRSDRLAPPDLAAAYLEKTHAPAKGLFLIDGGHFALLSNSDDFLRLLDERIRPIALGFDTVQRSSDLNLN
ncbi:MAG TPA: alpha/beta fold hydrolase [Steroidobacteraceae bacterium]|nr:alpha/beta fold hydrolase [Steroidobacteraceae bacterium]